MTTGYCGACVVWHLFVWSSNISDRLCADLELGREYHNASTCQEIGGDRPGKWSGKPRESVRLLSYPTEGSLLQGANRLAVWGHIYGKPAGVRSTTNR